MNGAENGRPSLEEMGVPQETIPTPDVTPGATTEAMPEATPEPQNDMTVEQAPLASAEPAAKEDAPTKPEIRSYSTPEQDKEELGKLEKQVVSGLATLYEVLPRKEKINKKRVEKAMSLVKELDVLLSGPKYEIARTVARKQLHLEPKEDFIATLMDGDLLQFALHAKAHNIAADKGSEQRQIELVRIQLNEQYAKQHTETPPPSMAA